MALAAHTQVDAAMLYCGDVLRFLSLTRIFSVFLYPSLTILWCFVRGIAPWHSLLPLPYPTVPPVPNPRP